jgi:hypothetical protein
VASDRSFLVNIRGTSSEALLDCDLASRTDAATRRHLRSHAALIVLNRVKSLLMMHKELVILVDILEEASIHYLQVQCAATNLLC